MVPGRRIGSVLRALGQGWSGRAQSDGSLAGLANANDEARGRRFCAPNVTNFSDVRSLAEVTPAIVMYRRRAGRLGRWRETRLFPTSSPACAAIPACRRTSATGAFRASGSRG
jgi:hypothetical protein